MVRAWYMNDTTESQQLPHHRDPPHYLELSKLREFGVDAKTLDKADYSIELNKIKSERGYTYQDEIEISPTKLTDYETKLKSFYDEHIHTDEEIRFVQEGSGYFDVRDHDDQWIRIEVSRGDLIILPAGIYHRFTLDTNNYIRAVRLFAGEPVWTPYSRSGLSHENSHVLEYRRKFSSQIV